jgi:hypothetical protein
MAGRPTLSLIGAALLMVVGLSGSAAGVTILQSMLATAPAEQTGMAIAIGILGYGLVLAAGGVGVFLGRRWGWWLGTIGIAIGLAGLIALTLITRLDPVFGFGLGLWTFTLVCLVAPSTRRSLNRQ